MSVSGVIGFDRNVAPDQLAAWYRDGLVGVAADPSRHGRCLVTAPMAVTRPGSGAGPSIVLTSVAPLFYRSGSGFAPIKKMGEKMGTEEIGPGGWLRADDGATVVIDTDRVQLFSTCAGATTFFYARAADHLVFSTSLGKLAAARRAPLDRMGLAEIMRFGAGYGARTLLEGIARVPVGFVLEVPASGRAVTARAYAEFYRAPDASLTRCQAALRGEIRDALTAAVQAIRDPVALLFSGGVDSTLLAQVLKRAGRPFTAWMLRLGEDDPEVANAQKIARALGIDLEVRTFEPPAWCDLERSIAAYEAPTLDFSILPTYQLGRLVRAATGVQTRLLDGTGGDAWFGFASLSNAVWWQRLSRLHPLSALARRLYGRWLERDGAPWTKPLKVLARAPRSRAGGLGHLCASPLYAWLLPRSEKDWLAIEREILALWSQLVAGRAQSAFSQVQVMDAVFIACSQFAAKTCQWDVGGGTFYPFLSPGLVDIARRLPPGLLLRGGVAKPLLKELMADLGLARRFAYRPKKGFQPPLHRLLTRPAVREEVLGLFEGRGEFIDSITPQARALARRLLAGDGRLEIQALYALWSLLVVTVWLAQLRGGHLASMKAPADG